MTVKRISAGVAGIVCSFVIVGCGGKSEEQSVVPVEEAVYAVNTYVTSEENLDEYLEFGGDVSAVSNVDIMPDTSGKLVGIRVAVGDVVKAGEIIAEVDPSKPGMTYVTSPVRAPVSGTITSFPLSSGTMVAPSMSVGKISSTKDLEINISVAERFVSRIQLGQKAILTFDAYPGEEFTAKVTSVSPVLDTTSRSMSVKLKVDPPDDRVKIGMYTRVKLITQTKEQVIVIPRSAVVTRNDADTVFVVDPATSTVNAVPVTVGITVDDKIEITSGLTVGAEVVISGQTLLDAGRKVNVVSRLGGDE